MIEQREIKFRAWDKANKRMLRDVPAGGAHRGSPTLTHLQYTGLKDRNGTEIYEGDVVVRWWRYKRKNDYAWIRQHHATKVIAWRESSTGVGWNIGKGEGGESRGEWEVIGNVFENPELT